MYEGEYRAGEKQGRGTYRYADGEADVGTYHGGEDSGEGVRWSADRTKAWRLRDGEEQATLELDEV